MFKGGLDVTLFILDLIADILGLVGNFIKDEPKTYPKDFIKAALIYAIFKQVTLLITWISWTCCYVKYENSLEFY
jgi:hypothetical protein